MTLPILIKHYAPVLLISLMVYPVAFGSEFDPFDNDDDIARLRAINGGELEFLNAEASQEPHLKTQTEISIRPQSLDDGWVSMHQCQHGLDAMETVEILYDYAGMRDLRVTRSEGIKTAWVDGKSVQLRGVQPNAVICVDAEVQILRPTAEGYHICSGPYHRRFFDGYFPLSLSLRIDYPADLLRLSRLDPPAQPGLSLQNNPGHLQLETHFVGRLLVQLDFIALAP